MIYILAFWPCSAVVPSGVDSAQNQGRAGCTCVSMLLCIYIALNCSTKGYGFAKYNKKKGVKNNRVNLLHHVSMFL